MEKSEYVALAAFRAELRRFLHFSETAARAHGMTPQQHQLLLAIKGVQGREYATVTEAAEALQLGHTAVVGLVDRCEKAGWVVRETAAEDRRQTHLRVTPTAEAILAVLSREHLRELHALESALARSITRPAETPDAGG